MNYVTFFINHTAYCIIIILALIVGLVSYILINKKQPALFVNLIAIALSGALSIVASCVVCILVSNLFTTQKLAYQSVFSIFYTICFFPLFMVLCQKTFAKGLDINTVTPSILLVIFVARIACAVEGCCQGRFYLATVEELLCLTGFVLYIAKKLKMTFAHFFIGYMTWRFIAEFFKESFTLERIGFLSLIQYVALIATLLATILLLKSKEIQNEKH